MTQNHRQRLQASAAYYVPSPAITRSHLDRLERALAAIEGLVIASQMASTDPPPFGEPGPLDDDLRELRLDVIRWSQRIKGRRESLRTAARIARRARE